MSGVPSKGSEDAKRYLQGHPESTAKYLAKRFKIDITTVYRADWWKSRTAAQKAEATK